MSFSSSRQCLAQPTDIHGVRRRISCNASLQTSFPDSFPSPHPAAGGRGRPGLGRICHSHGSSLSTGQILLSHAPSPVPGGAPGSGESQHFGKDKFPSLLCSGSPWWSKGVGRSRDFPRAGAEHSWILPQPGNCDSGWEPGAAEACPSFPWGKIPQKNGVFPWEIKSIPKSLRGTRGVAGGFPSARIPNIKDPKTQGHSQG